MKTEAQTHPSDRYLLCSHSLSDKTLERVKDDVKSFLINRQRDDLFHQFMNWQKKRNEIAVLTMYAFADILLPKQFDIVFQIDNLSNYVNINYTIRQAIINGWTSTAEIGYGHKHVLILKFENSVPDIFNLLSDFNEAQQYKTNKELGFCAKSDFELIKEKLNSKDQIVNDERSKTL